MCCCFDLLVFLWEILVCSVLLLFGVGVIERQRQREFSHCSIFHPTKALSNLLISSLTHSLIRMPASFSCTLGRRGKRILSLMPTWTTSCDTSSQTNTHMHTHAHNHTSVITRAGSLTKSMCSSYRILVWFLAHMSVVSRLPITLALRDPRPLVSVSTHTSMYMSTTWIHTQVEVHIIKNKIKILK